MSDSCLSECVSVCQTCLLTSLLWYGEGEVCRIWVVKKYEKPSLSNPVMMMVILMITFHDDVDDNTMDVVDGVSLPCQRVDEHSSARRHSCLGNLGNGD